MAEMEAHCTKSSGDKGCHRSPLGGVLGPSGLGAEVAAPESAKSHHISSANLACVEARLKGHCVPVGR
ncbi:unnamed protein product [Protopolystoma xenopodis]|uniref:Uncharacterized protein n=1 Tax=Protopolystoma xenopodis TaxID=117903 RepID=A0A3S5CHK7_9PLAT|nr:unnamed protein product [Protopolystoma xenopodis]